MNLFFSEIVYHWKANSSICDFDKHKNCFCASYIALLKFTLSLLPFTSYQHITTHYLFHANGYMCSSFHFISSPPPWQEMLYCSYIYILFLYLSLKYIFCDFNSNNNSFSGDSYLTQLQIRNILTRILFGVWVYPQNSTAIIHTAEGVVLPKHMAMKTTSYLQKYWLNLYEILTHYRQDVYGHFSA